MTLTQLSRTWTAVAVCVIGATACDEGGPVAPNVGGEPLLESVSDHSFGQSGDAHLDQGVREWIRAIRESTRAYKTFENAGAAGYVARLSECVESPAGGMGYHQGNPGLIDSQLDPVQPEVLLYEPRSDGSVRFVGVEFIVPIAAWTATTPPAVNGMSLHRNDALGLWALHVWTERHNPTGTFEDFNPKVSCEFAPDED